MREKREKLHVGLGHADHGFVPKSRSAVHSDTCSNATNWHSPPSTQYVHVRVLVSVDGSWWSSMEVLSERLLFLLEIGDDVNEELVYE